MVEKWSDFAICLMLHLLKKKHATYLLNLNQQSVILLCMHCVLQLFLPWKVNPQHFILLDCILLGNQDALIQKLLQCVFFPLLLAYHTCPPTSFTCANGRCIQRHFRCDHYNDCGDNSDESGCRFRSCNITTEFSCNNGKCLPLQLVCDGIDHCNDNNTSDEKNCGKFLFHIYCAQNMGVLKSQNMGDKNGFLRNRLCRKCQQLLCSN